MFVVHSGGRLSRLWIPAFAGGQSRKVAMRDSRCPSLQRLALLLREMYSLRTKAQSERVLHPLFLAERDLSRVNRLINRHRDLCPQCKFNDEQRKFPRQEPVRGPKVVAIDRTG